MDRALARLWEGLGDRVLLKGGLALELRLDEVRSTRDIDLRLQGAVESLELRRAGQLDLGDGFTFAIDPDPRHPTIAGAGVRYQGSRFRVQPKFAGKDYGRAFGLDVAVGGAVTGSVDVVRGDDLLTFLGLLPGSYRLLPRETHVAEKLHAYTLPRQGQLNSRVKDLPDLALLGRTGGFDAGVLRSAIDRTFDQRATHGVPAALASPPDVWAAVYAEMAAEDGLPWPTLGSVFSAAGAFIDGALEGEGIWDPARAVWAPTEAAATPQTIDGGAPHKRRGD